MVSNSRVRAFVIGALSIMAATPGRQLPQADLPASATLTVNMPDARSSFVLGERIPLELVFSGRADPDFYCSTASYDRGGRLHYEDYRITPADAVEDPLAEFYATNGVIGGGLSSWHALDGKPFTLRVDLNDWIRFRRPGQFTLVVTSRRLERYSRRPAPTVASPPVTIEITEPSESWRSAEVSRALVAIETHLPDRVREGAKILRHLDARESVAAMVARYDTIARQANFDVVAGLFSATDRSFVIETMERRVDAGDVTDAGFLGWLATVQSAFEHPLPGRDAAAMHARRQEILADLEARWIASSRQSPPTQGSLQRLLSHLSGATSATIARALHADAETRPDFAVAAFLALPADQQYVLLEYRWESLKAAWTGAALRLLYDALPAGPGSPHGFGAAVMKRLVEMTSDAGRRLILDELRSGAKSVGYDVLASLPEKELPELDDVLATRFERALAGAVPGADPAESAWLIARYASRNFVPAARRHLERGFACEIEAALIVYLLKHDVESTRQVLSPSLDRRDRCRQAPFGLIARRHWDQVLERAVIAHLDDQSIETSSQAAMVLGQYGTAAVRDALLRRLEEWSREWRGRQAELDRFPASPMALDSPVRIENAVVNALLSSDRWTLTPAELSRTLGLCVTDACRISVQSRLKAR
jgi:hypothetical protein